MGPRRHGFGRGTGRPHSRQASPQPDVPADPARELASLLSAALLTGTDHQLWDAFLRTRVRIFTPSAVCEITPLAPVVDYFPGPGCMYVVTAWNPRGRAAAPDVNDRAQQHLQDRLRASSIEWQPAAGVAEDGSWAEASVAVTDLTRSQARALGREWEQEAVFEWDESWDILSVVSCFDQDVTSRTATNVVLPFRPCPMAPPTQRRGDSCVRPMAGSTGKSTELAADFDLRRSVMLRALGCDVCHKDTVGVTPGRAGKPAEEAATVTETAAQAALDSPNSGPRQVR